MSGKGSAPRPFDVPREVFESNHARIFGERKKKDAPPEAAPAKDDANEVVLSEHEIGAIMREWQRTSNSRYELCRAVEAEVVRRCRAQRTHNNSSEE